MSRLYNLINLPPAYFQLPFKDAPESKKAYTTGNLLDFLFLFLLAAFSTRFGLLTEYGFDRLLWVFAFTLPLYYLLSARYRLLFLLLLFTGFIIYALGPLSSVFYIVSSIFILLVIRSKKQWWIYLVFFVFITGLALLRLEFFYFPRLIVAVPYLATAFMLRGIRFYYESKHEALHSGFWMELAYFFIPANLCFMLFPVPDPLRFSKSFTGIGQVNTGIRRLLIGMTLVLVYRFILNQFPVSFEEVIDFSSLLHYGALKYLFVLNVAGILICALGTISLCGFDLPPLFGNFLFAGSFSEMWRNINMYWREFMIRVFYYPLFFKLRKLNSFLRVSLSINLAFFISWLLHDYQLFWISGHLKIKATSLVYWMLFGNLVAFNIYQEFFFNKKPEKNPFKKGVYATGVFITCIFLWLIWESETFSEFGFLISSTFRSPQFTWLDLALTLLSLTSIYLAFSYLLFFARSRSEKLVNQLTEIVLPLFFLLLTASTFPAFESTFPQLKNSLSVFSTPPLSEEENFLRDEGYYENVVAGDKTKSWPWEIKLKGEKAWGNSKGSTRRTGDILLREFVPSSVTNMGYFTFKINSDGLRDDEYTIEKADSAFRFAMLGGSNECGYGVEKEQLFETITEKRLDSIYSKHIEIINFAGLGNMMLQDLEITKRKVLKYKPDVLLYFAHPEEYKHVARNLSKLILNGIDLKYDVLKTIREKAGVAQSMSRQEIISRLLPYSVEIIQWGYAEIANDCLNNGITPVWVFLPTTKDKDPKTNFQSLSSIARDNGYVVLDLSSAYKGYTFKEIKVSDTDFHPSALGHRLLANTFTEQLLRNKVSVGLEDKN